MSLDNLKSKKGRNFGIFSSELEYIIPITLKTEARIVYLQEGSYITCTYIHIHIYIHTHTGTHRIVYLVFLTKISLPMLSPNLITAETPR